MELDHVLIAVSDLATAARDIEARYGLASIEGGRHPKWGTANRIVPLGGSYLELITVVDETVASDSAFGRWVAGGARPHGQPLGWAVRPHDLDEAAGRLGLTVHSGSRMTPSGDILRWRSAGVDDAMTEPCLPFFIEWGDGVALPGTSKVDHPSGPVAIARLLVNGEPDRVAAWLGEHTLPIAVRAGRPSVAGVVLDTARGEIVLGHG